MTTTKNVSRVLGLAGMIAITGARVSSAQDYPDVGTSEEPLTSPYGVALSVGGGVEDFTHQEARNSTNLAGAWNLRLELGSLMPLSLELGYAGSASDVDAPLSRNTGTLIGTTIEGVVKGNLPTGTPITPFAFAGVGWRYYNVTSARFERVIDGMNDSDSELVVPVGAGLGFHTGAFVADVRFTFRPSFYDNLIVDNADLLSPSYANMDTWAVSGQIGVNI